MARKKRYYKEYKSDKFIFAMTDNSGELLDITDENIEKALIEAGIHIQRYATMNVPTDTSRLKASITYATNLQVGESQDPAKLGSPKDIQPKGQPEEKRLYVGTNVEYAPFVELGHTSPSGKKVPAQPYLRPAFENQTEDIKQIFEKYLTEI